MKMKNIQQIACFTLLSCLLAACGGGGGGSTSSSSGSTCNFNIASTPQSLTVAEVEQLIAQAIQASNSVGAQSTIAVVDRVGNVLGVFKMAGASATVNLRSGRALSSFPQGLDGLDNTVPSELASIAKAVTGAYLSSSGNAFSTRTASYIIQQHFPPGILQPSGPLFGVQFSQLPCSDFATRANLTTVPINGPKRSPLGLAGDPGGFPVYKNGVVVGGIGVISDGLYGIDINPDSGAVDTDEIIAQSALAGFEAPACIRAEKIFAGGQSLLYTNSDNRLRTVTAKTLADASANASGIKAVTGYVSNSFSAGKAYGNADSGFVADGTGSFDAGTYVITDGATNKYPPVNSTSPSTPTGLNSAEVNQILKSAIGVASQARAQIRQPLGSFAQVTVSVVDLDGNILGMARTADAPVFGADVSIQKARTAVFFSKPSAGADLSGLNPVTYQVGGTTVSITDYVTDFNNFFNSPITLNGSHAFSARAIGVIARPFYPDDGVEHATRGPFSKPISIWSPFNVGLQLDLVYNGLVNAILNPLDVNDNCTALTHAGGIPALKNGIQIFPGGVPIYRSNTLIGAIGVSGDGVTQDDMVSFLGLKRGTDNLPGSNLSNALASIRSDQLNPGLQYIICPNSPFLNTNQANVCSF